jgi:hypothetical protein
MSRRVFQVATYLQPNDGEPIRSTVHGVLSTGLMDLAFVSVASPALSGLQAL